MAAPVLGKQAVLELLQERAFRPPFWARSGLSQTLLGASSRNRQCQRLQLQRWPLPDGDFLRVHSDDPDGKAPLVVVLHGLEGSVASGYVGELQRLVRGAGLGLVVLEFRSCGGELNRLRRSYHSGETGDCGYLVERLRSRFPGRPLCLVGYSLGGNVLLKWLGECSGLLPAEVVAAAAVSAPYDLEVAAVACDQRYGGLIARHFLRTLVPKALAKARQFPGLLSVDAIRRCRSFAAFDELVTAPLHGFRSAQHYWRSSSCAQFLGDVRVPTLLLSAADDPLVPAAVLPHAEVGDSDYLLPLFTPRGGHCAFVRGGLPGWPLRWAEGQVLRFFAVQLAAAGVLATPTP